MGRWGKTLLVMAGLGFAAAAMASETVTYKYDARGRLTKVERWGRVNNGIASSYTYDRADNRLSHQVTRPCLIFSPLWEGALMPIPACGN